jgi:hypothetical protein
VILNLIASTYQLLPHKVQRLLGGVAASAIRMWSLLSDWKPLVMSLAASSLAVGCLGTTGPPLRLRKSSSWIAIVSCNSRYPDSDYASWLRA